MKKKIYLGIVLILIISLTGCFKRDNYEGIKIYTTSYPVEYLVSELYGYNSEVVSIYPTGVDYQKYELTNKQTTEYSKASIFVYNGLSEEKAIARNFINENNNLKIIDVSYGLSIAYGMEELWLAPNNYLMLATTLKNNLNELIINKYIKEEIVNNFANIEEKLSILDAELRTIGSSARSNGTENIVVGTDTFLFLNDYGFKVTSIQNKDNITDEVKTSFKSSKIKYILIDSRQKVSAEINDLVANNGAILIKADTMLVLTDQQINEKVNYLTIMKDFLDNIKKITLAPEK